MSLQEIVRQDKSTGVQCTIVFLRRSKPIHFSYSSNRIQDDDFWNKKEEHFCNQIGRTKEAKYHSPCDKVFSLVWPLLRMLDVLSCVWFGNLLLLDECPNCQQRLAITVSGFFCPKLPFACSLDPQSVLAAMLVRFETYEIKVCYWNKN